MCTVEKTCQKIHAFEAAGLGIAPFQYIGMEHQEISYGQRVISNVGGCALTTKPGGTCAYCGAYIVNMFRVRSADGQVFHVGSDCILKVGDAGMQKQVAEAIREKKRNDKRTRERALAIESAAWATSNRPRLNAMPHPCIEGKSYADYLDWMQKHVSDAAYTRAVIVAKNEICK